MSRANAAQVGKNGNDCAAVLMFAVRFTLNIALGVIGSPRAQYGCPPYYTINFRLLCGKFAAYH